MAFQLYQKGLKSQLNGEYAIAFQSYSQSLQLEKDPIARSFLFYNIGILYRQLNQKEKAFLNFHQSLFLNPSNPRAMNHTALLYHQMGEFLLNKGVVDQSNLFFERARQYWVEAVRLAPDEYLEAQNWLRH